MVRDDQGRSAWDDVDRARQLPGVSVVIPVYNGAKFLERTIRSAAEQTYPRLKIVAVDDGSTDGSGQILEDLKGSLPNLEVLTTANGGVARARNRGTEAADGDYIAYLDQDDLWHPTKIERQMQALLRHSDDPCWAGCYAANRLIDDEDRLLRIGIAYPARGSFFGSHLVINHVGNGSNLLVRRSAALKIGGFDPSYRERGIGGLEDWEFQLRLLQRYKVEYVPEGLVGYRIHGGTMSSQTDALARCMIAIVDKYSGQRPVPRALRRVAMSAAYRYAAPRFFVAGKYWLALRHFAQQLALDPVYGPRVALGKLWYRTKDRLRYRRWGAAGTPPDFASLEPTDLLAERESRRFRSLERWLARMDRRMEGSARDTPEPSAQAIGCGPPPSHAE